MGRHVNHYDVQDRLIIRNKIIAGRTGSLDLDKRDPASLSIVEQEELIKKRITERIKKEQAKIKPKSIQFTSKKY